VQLAHGISVALYNTGFRFDDRHSEHDLLAPFPGPQVRIAFVIDMQQQAVRLVEVLHGERQVMRSGDELSARSQVSDEPEINLIPMIDVLLVIIIFLMLTTTYAKFSGLEINLPTADASKQNESSPMKSA
jgi:hypothetical protein